ncbi:MAG: alpha-L-fucosidase [Niabella sp.]
MAYCSVRSQNKVIQHGAHREGKRNDAAMQEWRDYGLGMFMCWGIYSMYGGQYKGKDFGNAAEFIRGFVPKNEYDIAYKKFNAKQFSADDWALRAKKMGAKLLYFTAKYHDGFCMWPSKYTTYNIANTPYKKDVVKQIVHAFNKQGIDVHLYYSIMDWADSNNRLVLKTPDDYEANERFKIVIKNQLTELVKNYPTIKGLWFDGTWDDFWKKSGAFSDSLEIYLKLLNPNLIIGSRLRADEYGNRHIDGNGKLMGDFHQAWERKMPQDYNATKGYDWEFITTLAENGWGYQKNYLGHLKTTSELIEMMVKASSLDGNTMINFAPMGNGAVRPEEASIADSIGQWMEINNVVIYNTGYVKNWPKQDWGYITQNNQTGKIYLTVFNVPVSGKLRLTVPKGVLLKGAKMHIGKTALKIEKLDGLDYFIYLPKKNYYEAFVIELSILNAETKKTEKNALT